MVLYISTQGLVPSSPNQQWRSKSSTLIIPSHSNSITQNESKKKKQARVGDLLSTLPTPSLLVELSLMERYLHQIDLDVSVDDFIAKPGRFLSQQDKSNKLLLNSGVFFIHTQVICTERRDAVFQEKGSGKSLPVCDVDAPYEAIKACGGAYLGLGLANHHVGGYYWARSMGIGASLPAHGICFGPSILSISSNREAGELYWKKRGPGDPADTTEESSNSNDGKRSEWADFLQVGDAVQLVPFDPLALLLSGDGERGESCFTRLLGIQRAGRPLGADPIVEKIWTWSNDTTDNWKLL